MKPFSHLLVLIWAFSCGQKTADLRQGNPRGVAETLSESLSKPSEIDSPSNNTVFQSDEQKDTSSSKPVSIQIESFQSPFEVKLGELIALPVKVIHEDGKFDYTDGAGWSAADSAILSLSEGLVRADKAGTTNLKATFGDFSAEIAVTVVAGKTAIEIETCTRWAEHLRQVALRVKPCPTQSSQPSECQVFKDAYHRSYESYAQCIGEGKDCLAEDRALLVKSNDLSACERGFAGTSPECLKDSQVLATQCSLAKANDCSSISACEALNASAN